jgi:protease I
MTQKTTARDRIAILVENDYQDQEVWVPLYRLREAGYQTVVLGTGAPQYKSKFGYPIAAEMAAAQAKSADFKGVVIPGGWAPDRLRQDQGVLALVRELDKEGRMVAAICHAGWVLASAEIVRGRRVTCYQAIRDDLTHAGAQVVDEEVVRDRNLITSRKPDDLPAFCREMVRFLQGA